MTGDGVNDGPALQRRRHRHRHGRSGTDVAREAADLVLLDDDFATIVAAIEQGRATFANIRRFLTYHLTDNVAELTPFVVWALSGGRFPLALGVLQILCLDIGTDLLPALALGAEPPNARRARPAADAVATSSTAPLLRRVFGVLGPDRGGGRDDRVRRRAGRRRLAPGRQPSRPAHALLAASGAAFAAVVIGQAANAFACRSATRLAGRARLDEQPAAGRRGRGRAGRCWPGSCSSGRSPSCSSRRRRRAAGFVVAVAHRAGVLARRRAAQAAAPAAARAEGRLGRLTSGGRDGHQHRAAAVVHGAGRGRAEDGVAHRAVAAVPDDDQIGVDLVGDGEQFVADVAGPNVTVHVPG